MACQGEKIEGKVSFFLGGNILVHKRIFDQRIYNACAPTYQHMFNYQETSYLWRTSLYLAASASAEFFADIALCPFEAVKVRIQTQPGFARTMREGMPKLYGEEGIAG